MPQDLIKSITQKIIKSQDENGCWNVLKKGDKYYPDFNYYAPNYKSTLWTLVLLADIQCDPGIISLKRPLRTIARHFLDRKWKIYSLGKSHFPIPCLNGNMLYLHSYFQPENASAVTGIVDFFAEYQRFDDGEFQTPSSFPYCSNHSCYGNHTCFWGVIKLLKGLSFIPKKKRTANARKLAEKCIDFILLHRVCYGSHDPSRYLRQGIEKMTFPNMYHGDFLEILWLLKREGVKSEAMQQALMLLKSKMKPEAAWEMECRIKNLIIPLGKNEGNEFITRRAREVMGFYGKWSLNQS